MRQPPFLSDSVDVFNHRRSPMEDILNILAGYNPFKKEVLKLSDQVTPLPLPLDEKSPVKNLFVKDSNSAIKIYFTELMNEIVQTTGKLKEPSPHPHYIKRLISGKRDYLGDLISPGKLDTPEEIASFIKDLRDEIFDLEASRKPDLEFRKIIKQLIIDALEYQICKKALAREPKYQNLHDNDLLNQARIEKSVFNKEISDWITDINTALKNIDPPQPDVELGIKDKIMELAETYGDLNIAAAKKLPEWTKKLNAIKQEAKARITYCERLITEINQQPAQITTLQTETKATEQNIENSLQTVFKDNEFKDFDKEELQKSLEHARAYYIADAKYQYLKNKFPNSKNDDIKEKLKDLEEDRDKKSFISTAATLKLKGLIEKEIYENIKREHQINILSGKDSLDTPRTLKDVGTNSDIEVKDAKHYQDLQMQRLEFLKKKLTAIKDVKNPHPDLLSDADKVFNEFDMPPRNVELCEKVHRLLDGARTIFGWISNPFAKTKFNAGQPSSVALDPDNLHPKLDASFPLLQTIAKHSTNIDQHLKTLNDFELQLHLHGDQELDLNKVINSLNNEVDETIKALNQTDESLKTHVQIKEFAQKIYQLRALLENRWFIGFRANANSFKNEPMTSDTELNRFNKSYQASVDMQFIAAVKAGRAQMPELKNMTIDFDNGEITFKDKNGNKTFLTKSQVLRLMQRFNENKIGGGGLYQNSNFFMRRQNKFEVICPHGDHQFAAWLKFLDTEGPKLIEEDQKNQSKKVSASVNVSPIAPSAPSASASVHAAPIGGAESAASSAAATSASASSSEASSSTETVAGDTSNKSPKLKLVADVTKEAVDLKRSTSPKIVP